MLANYFLLALVLCTAHSAKEQDSMDWDDFDDWDDLDDFGVFEFDGDDEEPAELWDVDDFDDFDDLDEMLSGSLYQEPVEKDTHSAKSRPIAGKASHTNKDDQDEDELLQAQSDQSTFPPNSQEDPSQKPSDQIPGQQSDGTVQDPAGNDPRQDITNPGTPSKGKTDSSPVPEDKAEQPSSSDRTSAVEDTETTEAIAPVEQEENMLLVVLVLFAGTFLAVYVIYSLFLRAPAKPKRSSSELRSVIQEEKHLIKSA